MPVPENAAHNAAPGVPALVMVNVAPSVPSAVRVNARAWNEPATASAVPVKPDRVPIEPSRAQVKITMTSPDDNPVGAATVKLLPLAWLPEVTDPRRARLKRKTR